MPVRGDNSLFFASGIDTSGLSAGANQALGIIRNLATSIGAISPFAILASGAIAAFTAIGNSAYQMMAKFELAMAEVKTIANVSEQEFEELKKQVFALSQELGTEPPDALAKGLYDIIGAGYAAGEALQLLEISTKAATAGVTTSAVAADGLTTILNAFGLAASDATEVADIMFQTVNLGKITFEELSSQIAQVAPLAAASGFSFKEIAAAVATLTKQGVPASVAMTQIRSGIISVGEVMGSGAAKAMTLQAAFQEMYNRAGGDQDQLKKLAGRIEAVSGILSIAGPNFQGATEDLIAMGDAAGAVDESFEHITDATTNQWKILGNRIQATTKGIGSTLLEMSNVIARAMNDALESGDKLKENYDEQRIELRKLEVELQRAVVGSKEFEEIRDRILRDYPEFIGGIDAETASTAQLLGVLKQVNEAYTQRYKFASRQEDLNEALQRQAFAENSMQKARVEFEDFLLRLEQEAGDKGIKLRFDLNASTGDILNSIKEQLQAADPTALEEMNFPLFKRGWAMDNIVNLEARMKMEKSFLNILKQESAEVETLIERNERLAKLDLKTTAGQSEALKAIAEATDMSELSMFMDSGIEAIEKALQARKSIIDQLTAISEIDTKKGLAEYLKSENEEIRKAAEFRSRMITTDYAGVGAGTGDEEEKTFADFLDDRKKQYEKYYAAIEQLGKESADRMFASLLEEGANYGEYLQNQLEEATSVSQQIDIAVAAQGAGVDLNREVQKTISSLEQQPVVLDVELDTTSINYYRRKIQELNEQIEEEQDALKRRELQGQRDKWQERLDIAENGSEEEKSIYEKLPLELGDLNKKELRKYKEYWKEKLDIARVNSDALAAEEAKTKIGAANQAIAEMTADTLSEVSGTLREASNLFREFGDDVLADALDKLSGLATNIGTIMTGVASGNWLQVASGVLGGITSLFSGEKEQGPSEYERSITRLDSAIRRLGNEISMAFGSEAIELQNRQLEEYLAKTKAIEEELKELELIQKGLGFIVSDDLDEKIDKLRTELSDLQSEYASAYQKLAEDITGTTRDSITESIIQGFREGKSTIEDFADTFEELMSNALLKAFETQFLAKQINKFYEDFYKLAGDESGLTPEDIALLKGTFSGIITQSEKWLEDMNKILTDSGLDPLEFRGGADRAQGLSGAITNITEDTANILAGYMNAIRLDIRQGLSVAITNSQHLGQISINTSHLPSISEKLSTMDSRFANIEKGIQEFQARG